MMLQVPPIPKKEKAAVTIANQSRQIDNLLEQLTRVTMKYEDQGRKLIEIRSSLVDSEKMLNAERRQVGEEQIARQAHLDHINGQDAKIARLESQIEGYRMAIKDICGS